MNTETFLLPDFGEGLQEAKVLKWHVEAGATLTENMPVVTVETSKTTVEISANSDGVFTRALAEPNTNVNVGEALYSYHTHNPENSKTVTASALHINTEHAWQNAVHTVAMEEVNIDKWFKKNHVLYKIIQALHTLNIEFPCFNAHYHTQSYQLEPIASINAGIARYRDNATHILTVDNAQELSEETFCKQLQQSNSSQQGSCSILLSNVGMMGGRFFTPLVIPPMTTTIAIGKIVKKPVVVADNIKPAYCMPLSICSDHRIVAGAQLAQFIDRLKTELER